MSLLVCAWFETGIGLLGCCSGKFPALKKGTGSVLVVSVTSVDFTIGDGVGVIFAILVGIAGDFLTV